MPEGDQAAETREKLHKFIVWRKAGERKDIEESSQHIIK